MWHWLKETYVTCMCIAVIVAAFCISLTWRSEASIRTVGWALQVLGMILAIRGLLKIRTHFGQPSFWKIFSKWLKRFPKFKKKTVIEPGITDTVSVSDKVEATVWSPDDPNLLIESRIHRLVNNLERLREKQDKLENDVEELRIKLGSYQRNFTEDIKKQAERILSDSEKLHTNDIDLSIVGLLWLTIGISMSTMAPEVYKLLF